MNEVEKIKNVLTLFLKQEGLKEEDYVFDFSLADRLIIRRTLGNVNRNLWVTPLKGDFEGKFSLLWSFYPSDDQGLEGRRLGSLNYTLSIVKYWIVDWKEFGSIPYEDD